MTNFQVYKKTLIFSVLMFIVDLFILLIIAGLAILGFVIMDKVNNKALIGLVVGLVVGIILTILIDIFILNRMKAAQISMMTMGVVDNKLPDKPLKEGFTLLKGRFGRITGFYFITHAIKGIFRQIGRGIERVGSAVGGDVGEGVASAVNSAIQILIGYMCDCCMGWILYRKNVNGFKAGCEGAVIFFKHGKTLIRNVGRIFGIGFLSFAVIGGAFFGISYLIFNQFPSLFDTLAKEIVEFSTRNNANLPDALKDPKILSLIASGIIGVVVWGMLHSILIRPFILVGVLRNFMAAGIKDMPTEKDFDTLAAKSPKFAKLQSKI